jgi:hypothetical protein
VLIGLGVLVVAAAIVVGVVALGGDDDTASPPSSVASTVSTDVSTSSSVPGSTLPECTSSSGRCAFLTDIQLDGDKYVAEYVTVAYDPLIFERGVQGASSDHHVHFFFDTEPERNAGTNGSPPGEWVVWDRPSGGGQLVFDALGPSDRPNGATQLCVGVADSAHGIEVGTGNCLDLPTT